ncbi:MAG: hypothetical protein K2W82_14425 [Candidatus Obscuribacterales bacterium]|nr:hypothetical protein [Candidatus Obscuribacterales bacterium]
MGRSFFGILKYAIAPAVFVLVLSIGLPVIKSKPDVYTASAKVWIQAQYPKSGTDSSENATGLYLPFTSFFNDPIKTAAEVIHSDMVLEYAYNEALKSLPKNKCPTKGMLKSGLKTEEVKGTDVLSLSYSNPNPRVAYIGLKGIVDGFLELNSSQSAASAVRTRKFLQQQIKLLREKLTATGEQIKQFHLENKTVDLSQDISTKLTAIAVAKGKIQDQRVEIAKQQQLVSYLHSRKRSDTQLVAALKDDATIQGLDKSIAEKEVALAHLSNNLHEGHPRIQVLRQNIESLRKATDERIRVLTEHANKNPQEQNLGHKHLLNIDKSAGMSEVGQAETDLRAMEGALAAQSHELSLQQEQLATLPAKQLRYAELKRLEELQSQELSDLEGRLNSAEMIETVASGVTNIQIIDPPSIPSVPSGPSEELIMLAVVILAALLSAGSAILVHFLTPTIRSVNDVYAILGYPIIGTVPTGDGHSQSAESKQSFDRLRLAFLRFLADRDKMVCITGGAPGQGKTYMAVGICQVLAESGRKVCLIEADEYNPSVVKLFNLRNPPTLQRYLMSPTPSGLENLLVEVAPNFWVAACEAHQTIGSAFELDSGRRFIAELHKHFDYVIFDTADVAQSAVAFSLFSQGVLPIIIVRMQHALKKSLLALTEQIQLQNIQRGAVILNGTDQQVLRRDMLVTGKTTAETPATSGEEEEEDQLWS